MLGMAKVVFSILLSGHDGDWSNDKIRETWLWCFIWVENFLSFLAWLRAYTFKIWNEVLLNWMGGEFTSSYCISISKCKVIGNFRASLVRSSQKPVTSRGCVPRWRLRESLHWFFLWAVEGK
ncbi:hypothetical protein TNCV_3351221 [Trichonephila clavipes]|nr:hypothetical protein TNCV_3351221 [Trichonephila clavipes]